jgi:ABC-type amino acid transport substrate-binding protein
MRVTIFAVLLLVAAAAAGLLMTVQESRPGDEPPPEAPAGPDHGDSYLVARAAGEGTVRVLFVPAEGFAFRTETGELSGVTVEIARDFQRWLGEHHGVDLNLQFVEEPDWRTFYGRVRDASGGVMGLGNVTITEQRREELQFSPPYLTNVAVLITHSETPELAAMDAVAETFAGLTPLAFEGTLHETRLAAIRERHAPDHELAFATANDEIIERVASGEYYAYVDAYNYWRARERGTPLRRHSVADDPGEEFGIILPLDSDWTAPLAEFFAHDGGYRNSPRYRTLLVEHLGEGVAEALLAALADD